MSDRWTRSIGKAKYILTFIDDFSRKIFTYFLNNKSQVFGKFKEFKNTTDEKIKILRTDNGTEYMSNEFEKFPKNAGIGSTHNGLHTAAKWSN